MGWKTICIKDSGNNIHSQNVTVDKEYRPQIYINSIDELKGLITK